MLNPQPITFKEANRFIQWHHRHNVPSHGWKFGLALNDGSSIVGVICVGTPVARHLDDGFTVEVTRCCTDGTKNAPSMLYGRAAQAARALGWKKILTYIREDEPGTSLKAAGWLPTHRTRAEGWDRPGRQRAQKSEVTHRVRYEKILGQEEGVRIRVPLERDDYVDAEVEVPEMTLL